MQMIGAGREAFHQKVQEPRETDAHGTAEPTECDALAQQLFDPPALLGRNTPVIALPMRGTSNRTCHHSIRWNVCRTARLLRIASKVCTALYPFTI